MYIKISGLTKYIKKEKVLDEINLFLEGGKIYGLQGKNGCGKTMLMRCISGLVRPAAGSIVINDKQLHKDISFPESIGILIENPVFLPQYSGYDNLKMLSGFQEGVTEEEVVRLLEQVGLADAPKKKFEAYSLGMRQRLGIAAAVMGAPELIILDEPINAIDENGVEDITRLILDLKSPDRIIIVACHDQSELELLADEVVVLSQGKIKEIRGCAYEDNQTVEA